VQRDTGRPQKLATYPAIFVLPERTDSTRAIIAMVETNRAWLYTYEPALRAPLNRAGRHYLMATLGSRSYPTFGSMVLLPYKWDDTTFRLLALGGQHESNANHRDYGTEQPATNTAEIFDLDVTRALTDQPGWRRLQPMGHPRILCDATLLADGTVLVSGGARRGWANKNSDPVREAELFDPEHESFQAAASAELDRRYHATALLQPDGTVLKAGSHGGFSPDRDDRGWVWIRSHTDAERYFPPYLWRGPRPRITGVDTATLRYDSVFTVTAEGAGLDNRTRLAVIRLGSVTHGFDMDQRYVWLNVTSRVAEGNTWRVSAALPRNPAAAPPGDYLLVVVDGSKVPSPARLVRIAAS
jgi:hypothetical protein